MFDNSILKAFFSLILLVGVLGLLLFILKKFTIKTRKNRLNQLELNIISHLTLLPKVHLFVVKAASKTLLLGVSDKNINALSELSDEGNYHLDTTQKAFNALSTDVSLSKQGLGKSKPDDSLSFRSFLRSTLKKS
jgi:flagellar biogenesis protein FliO